MNESIPKMTERSERTVVQRMIAEMFGTFLLVFLGCGAVHAAVLLNAQSGLWQVAVVWGLAIMLAIFVVDSISGAHINPAMTIAFAVFGKHPWRLVAPYVLAQLAGAMIAAALLYCLFVGYLDVLESAKGVQRGEPGSIVTAMCYGEYFPNPGALASKEGGFNPQDFDKMAASFGYGQAFVAELVGTMLLACIVFAITDTKNGARPLSNLAPVFIGLTVSALISVLAPLTQAGFNPARDFGPRLFAYFAGWGSVAIPGPNGSGWFVVYIIAPILGAILGGGLYQFGLRPGVQPPSGEKV